MIGNIKRWVGKCVCDASKILFEIILVSKHSQYYYTVSNFKTKLQVIIHTHLHALVSDSSFPQSSLFSSVITRTHTHTHPLGYEGIFLLLPFISRYFCSNLYFHHYSFFLTLFFCANLLFTLSPLPFNLSFFPPQSSFSSLLIHIYPVRIKLYLHL